MRFNSRHNNNQPMTGERDMSRIPGFAYGLVCYAMFLAVFLYLVAFINDVPGMKTVSSGAVGPMGPALAVDLALIALFGIQHSVMARAGFKRWFTAFVPTSVERSSYVLATNIVLILTYHYWQPLAGQIWKIDDPTLATALYALGGLGWLMVLISTFLTHHFDLFGLRQVWLNLLRRSYTPIAFREQYFYRWIRHPMMTGLFIAFWATPDMTASHLLFSLGMTIYVFIGVHFEERGLREELGQPYRDYAARTGRFLPFA
ncbi:methanethiol S-methyltransferase [Nevskia sp.]|uniref:methanethiol S-methyltransferase n=1 Tax=Nevskia sp. TaxID=1929292 RepID=UPI0025FBB428|nr:methanethiol S-methyltransferase [Nevskia sp.]